MCEYYVYDYNAAQYDEYVAYLKSSGFSYLDNEAFEGGVSYYYYNEKDSIMADLFVTSDNTELWIWMTLE